MRFQQWQAKVDTSQGKLLPLIAISMLCVQILSAARNPIMIGQTLPMRLLISDAIFFAITAGLVLWVRRGTIPEHLTRPIAAFAYMVASFSSRQYRSTSRSPAALLRDGDARRVILFSFLALFPHQCFRPRTTVDSSRYAITDNVAGTLYASRFRSGRCTWVLYHAAQNPWHDYSL
ncbi:MAG: hypothetical protein ACI8XU_001585 [Kiritimatiellia bacterium]|jgi:hypothetical protein